MMAERTPDFVGSNSFPVMFQGLFGSISFPRAVPCVMISSLYMAMGELYCLLAILAFPTVVKPCSFCPGSLPVLSNTCSFRSTSCE